MLKMLQIDLIKDLQRKGIGPKQIASQLNLDRKTVSKYMKKDDFEPKKPIRLEANHSKLDPFKSQIIAWLEEDRKNRYKQRHTAQRIHQRLTEEFAEYDGSYSSIQRFVRALKLQSQAESHAEGNQELVWHPGEAQVDFGEVDTYDENGELQTGKFLCISFPFSNAAYAQLFGGETAECVVKGLQDIFQHMGGVPPRLVFDNASGVGKRVYDQVRLTDLFLRFKMHYGFDVTFCNPYAGHEKGNVENKVGYIRRNFFVPLPTVIELETFNRQLFKRCEADWQRNHYKKSAMIADLFAQDKNAFSYLPTRPFSPVRYLRVKTDGYGKFSVDGKHYYSSAPEYASCELVIQIGAHHIEPLDAKGIPICTHRRKFGLQRTDSVDVRTTISRLLRNPGSWRNSLLRERVSEPVRNTFDGFERSELKEALRTIEELSARYGFEAAMEAIEQTVKKGRFTTANASVMAAHLTTFEHQPASNVDLAHFDQELLMNRGVIQ